MTLSTGAGERRVKSITNLSNNSWTVGASPTSTIHGEQHPNPYVAFAINQAWGAASLSATANPIHSTYYRAAPGIAGYAPTAACIAQPATTLCGYPGDEWGFSVNGGVEINLPQLALGDKIGGYAAYSQGAGAYGAGNTLQSPGLFGGGNINIALGALTDAVYVNGSGFELTTVWTVGAGFKHFWTPQLMTALTANYTDV